MNNCIDYVDDFLYENYMHTTDEDVAAYKDMLRCKYDSQKLSEEIPNFDDYVIIATLYKFDVVLRDLRKELMTLDNQCDMETNSRKRAYKRAYSLGEAYYLGTMLRVLVESWAIIAVKAYPLSEKTAQYLMDNDSLFTNAIKYYHEVDGSLIKMISRSGNQLPDFFDMIPSRANSEVKELETMKDHVSRYYKTRPNPYAS